MSKFSILSDLDSKEKKKVRKWVKPSQKPPSKWSGVQNQGEPGKNYYNEITRPISDHVFGSKTRIQIPESIEHTESNKSKPSKHVQMFLDENSYSANNADYKKGVAYHLSDENRRRPLKIGKILEKHGAHDKIKKAFMNDPYRATAKSSHLTATVSRHPFDVAGMSTDRGWTSCLDLRKGIYKKDVNKELQHGTHVAYLHHKTDKTISHPVARIALKPYEADGEKPILRPETKTYGTTNPEFHQAVSHWAKQNFPLKENVIYSKNSHVYDDDSSNSGNQTFVNHTNNEELFKRNSIKKIEDALEGNKLEHLPIKYHEVEHVLPKLNGLKHSFILEHIEANADHDTTKKLLSHDNPAVRAEIISSNKLTDEEKKPLMHDPDDAVRNRYARTTLNREHLRHLAKDKEPAIAKVAKWRLDVLGEK